MHKTALNDDELSLWALRRRLCLPNSDPNSSIQSALRRMGLNSRSRIEDIWACVGGDGMRAARTILAHMATVDAWPAFDGDSGSEEYAHGR
jgi:hypothetical protein